MCTASGFCISSDNLSHDMKHFSPTNKHLSQVNDGPLWVGGIIRLGLTYNLILCDKSELWLCVGLPLEENMKPKMKMNAIVYRARCYTFWAI